VARRDAVAGRQETGVAAAEAVHTATFDIDESALPIGSSTLAGVALDYLKR